MIPLFYPLNTDISKLPFSTFSLLLILYLGGKFINFLVFILDIWQIHVKFLSYPSIEYWYPKKIYCNVTYSPNLWDCFHGHSWFFLVISFFSHKTGVLVSTKMDEFCKIIYSLLEWAWRDLECLVIPNYHHKSQWLSWKETSQYFLRVDRLQNSY